MPVARSVFTRWTADRGWWEEAIQLRVLPKEGILRCVFSAISVPDQRPWSGEQSLPVCSPQCRREPLHIRQQPSDSIRLHQEQGCLDLSRAARWRSEELP